MINNLISQQEEIIKALDELLKQNPDNFYLISAVFHSIITKGYLEAYSKGLRPRMRKSLEDRREYMRRYMADYGKRKNG